MAESQNAEVLQRSLQLFAAHRNELTAHFFGRLFGRYPELQVYFADSDPAWLERKFASALRSIMQAAVSPDEFAQQLSYLRQVHDERSVAMEHFALFGEVLIDSLAYYGGRGWTPDVELAWRSVLTTVTESISALRDDGAEAEALCGMNRLAA